MPSGGRFIDIGKLRDMRFNREELTRDAPSSGFIPPHRVGQGIPVPGFGGQGTWDHRTDNHPGMFGAAVAPGFHMPYGAPQYPMAYGAPMPVQVGGYPPGYGYGSGPTYPAQPGVGGLIPNQIQIGMTPDVKSEIDGLKKQITESVERLKQPGLPALIGLVTALVAGVVAGRMWEERRQERDTPASNGLSRSELNEALQHYFERNEVRIQALVDRAVEARLAERPAPKSRRIAAAERSPAAATRVKIKRGRSAAS